MTLRSVLTILIILLVGIIIGKKFPQLTAPIGI